MNFKYTLLICFLFFQTLATAQHPELIPYKKGEFWGYANYEGEIIIAAEFEKVKFFGRNYAEVWNDNKMGLVSPSGEMILSTKYERIFESEENLFSIRKDGKWGISIKKDKIVLYPMYDDIHYQRENCYKVKKKNKFGIIKISNNKSKTIIPCKYDEIRNRNSKDGSYIFSCSKKGEPKSFYDNNGKFLHSEKNKQGVEQDMFIEMVAEEPPPPSSDSKKQRLRKSSYPYQLITEGEKEGMVIKGDTIPAIYDYIDPRHDFNNAYTVKKDGKWGVINPKNEFFLDIVYDSIDLKKVSYQNIWGKEYRQIFFVQNNGLWGVVGNKNKLRVANGENEILIPLEYASITKCVNNKWFILEKDGLFGVAVNGDFSVSIPPKYKKIKGTYHVVGGHYIYTVTNDKGAEVFVGQNGVEYFSE